MRRPVRFFSLLSLSPSLSPQFSQFSSQFLRFFSHVSHFCGTTVRDAVGIILRGNTGTSIVEQIMRVQQAGAIGVAIINTSSEKFNPDVVEQELAPEAGAVVVPVVVIRDVDGETIPRRATISVLNSGRARGSTAAPAPEPPQEPEPRSSPGDSFAMRMQATPREPAGPQEPPPRSQDQAADAGGSRMDREAVRAMAIKLGREQTDADLDRAMAEMGAGYGDTDVSFDAFCQWWAEETVRVRLAGSTAAADPAPQSPPPMASHTATHEEISRQMARGRSPPRPRAPSPQPPSQADGTAVEAALIQAGVDPETSLQILRGLEASGKLRPGSSPRRVRDQSASIAYRDESAMPMEAVEDEAEGEWLTASDEARKPQPKKAAPRSKSRSTNASRRYRKVQGVKPAVSRRVDEAPSYIQRPEAAAPRSRTPDGSPERDQMPESFRELSQFVGDDGRYSGYPAGYGAEPPRQEESSRKHRSRKKDRGEGRSHHRRRDRDGEGEGQSRSRDESGRRRGDKSKSSHRHRSSRRAARHVMTDDSTVRSPRDQLAPPYSDEEDFQDDYSPVKSEKQDPRILQQVDELCQSIPEFAAMKPHERKLMVEVLQPFTAEPGTRFIAQGDEGDAMYILAVGQCKASISRPGQPDEEVARYKPGDYFGELALMDRAPRKANVDAVTDITCLRIAAREFDRVLGGTTAYASMERKAVKSRAIAARVMAQTAAMSSPRQPAAPAPVYAPAPVPVQQYALPPAPAPAPLPVQQYVLPPAPAPMQLPVSAPPPSVTAVAAALPPLPMASPARPPVQRTLPNTKDLPRLCHHLPVRSCHDPLF